MNFANASYEVSGPPFNVNLYSSSVEAPNRLADARKLAASLGSGSQRATLLVGGVGSSISTLTRLKKEVEAFRAFPDGWDGEGSKQPSVQAVHAAITALSLVPAGMSLPKSMLSFDGEIGLYWDLPNGYADLNFDASGRNTFFSRDRGGAEHFEEIGLGQVDASWFWSRLGALEERLPLAA